MKFNENPYYDPEKCGLEIFESIDTGGSYEFDMFVIWRKLDDNTLWWDTDSGCSCPTPFDPHEDRHDLTPITEDTIHNFYEALENHYHITRDDIYNIKNKVEIFLIDNNWVGQKAIERVEINRNGNIVSQSVIKMANYLPVGIDISEQTYSRNDVVDIIYKVLTATGKDIKVTMMNILSSNPYVEFDGNDLEAWIELNVK